MGSSVGHEQSASGETELTRTQAEILRSRETQYQQIFYPALLQELQATEPGGMTQNMLTRQNVEATQAAFKPQGDQFAQLMAQRGLTGSGVEARGLAALGAAKGSALADAVLKSNLANMQQRSQLIQMGGSLSPQPTTAAPIESRSSGRNLKLW